MTTVYQMTESDRKGLFACSLAKIGPSQLFQDVKQGFQGKNCIKLPSWATMTVDTNTETIVEVFDREHLFGVTDIEILQNQENNRNAQRLKSQQDVAAAGVKIRRTSPKKIASKPIHQKTLDLSRPKVEAAWISMCR